MRRRIILLPAVVTAVVLAAAGCESRPAAGHPGVTEQPARPAAPVSIQLVLPSTTMTTGTRLAAHVKVDNNTGHAIHVPGCGAPFTVALASSTYRPVIAVLTCVQLLTIRPGWSSYRVLVLASYLSCSPGHASGARPACLPGMRMPPLPPGRYHATLFFLVREFAPAPPAIPVRVIRAVRSPVRR